jgi:deoxyribonuclease-4
MPRFRYSEKHGDLIGAHLSSKGGLHTVFERAAEVNATAIALFAKNSNQWKGKELTDDDCKLFAKKRFVKPVFTHASYLINLATTNAEFHNKSIAAMIDELDRAERLGIRAVVLHPGAHMGAGADAGIEKIARSLDKVHAKIPNHKVVTLLETSAGQGSCVGCSFEELGKIIASVDDSKRVGICFDTCHVFASGYDLRTYDAYERSMEELDRSVGVKNVGLFHLNDSKKALGSRVDRHEHIGDGQLGLEAFRFLLNDERFRGIPKLLETPKKVEHESDRRNLATLRSLLNSPPNERQAGTAEAGTTDRIRSWTASRPR